MFEGKEGSVFTLDIDIPPGNGSRPAIVDGGSLPEEARPPVSLAAALRRAAKTSPAKGIIYLADDGSECSQSYASLLKESSRILAGLRRRIQPGERVILQLESSRDFIPAFWACVLGGFIPLPLLPCATERAFSTLNLAWNIFGRPTVVAESNLESALRSFFHNTYHLEPSVALLSELRKCEEDNSAHEPAENDTAFYLLTSGSTGVPKIAILTQRNVLSSVSGSAYVNGFTAEEVSLNWLQMNHVGALMRSIREVVLGCTQIQAPTQPVLADPVLWLEWMHRYGVTTSWSPNFAFGLVVERAFDIFGRKCWDFSRLKSLWSSGEAVLPATMKKFHQLLSPFGLAAEAIHTAWGMTEACFATYSHGFLTDSRSDGRWPEVGLPIPGIAARIVDEHDRLLEEPAIGRLQIKGPVCAVGYYGNTEQKIGAFTPDGWLRTGDLGFLRNGRLTVTGRESERIIINGVNYAPAEIEAALMGIPGLEYSNFAACSVEESPGAGEHLAVFFYTSLTENGQLQELRHAIRGALNRKLGINPEYLLHVGRSDIPKTPLGKIQRGLLKQRFERGDFEALLRCADPIQRRRGSVPRTSVEKKMARIWTEVLGTPQVDLRDSFFDLGGHSILAAQLVARIEKEFRIHTPLAILFQRPTIAQLAEFLSETKVSHPFGSLVPIQSQGSKPPFFWVHGDWSNSLLPGYLGSDQPLYSLDHQAQDGRPARYKETETIARHYLDEVRAVRPRGPYLFGGFSFGALIAFEMAHQLRREGENVKLVFMLDPPHTIALANEPTIPLVQEFRIHRQALSLLSPRQKLEYLALRVKDRVSIRTEWMTGLCRKLRQNYFMMVGRPLPSELRSDYILEIYRKARQSYVAKPYSGRVTIYKSVNARFRPEMDWLKLCTGELDVFEGPGGHMDMTREPFVSQWATRLKASLDCVQ
jgi:acyl-CoA synthetase (AMP-forming)/AMP-acid ligase II/thioesterase domain-containing protein/acyl carrier protein